MKKVISFTLYKAPTAWENVMETNFEKYTLGIQKNLELIEKYYPTWTTYLYHNEDLILDFFEEIERKFNVETKMINDFSVAAMQWRFLPNDEEDVDCFIVRDADSRITEREKVSVEEWLESDKTIHIMRDHPHHHYEILGGMWGMKSQKDFNITNSLRDYNKEKGYNIEKDWYEKWWDMNFLRDVIYKKYSYSSYINCSSHGWESWSKPFTLDMEDRHFIGEIFKSDDKRDNHYLLL